MQLDRFRLKFLYASEAREHQFHGLGLDFKREDVKRGLIKHGPCR